MGHTAYCWPQPEGKRGAFCGAGTTAQRRPGVGESCKCARGTGSGLPFTSTIASLAVSLRMRYQAPRRRGCFSSAFKRAHWKAVIAAPRALGCGATVARDDTASTLRRRCPSSHEDRLLLLARLQDRRGDLGIDADGVVAKAQGRLCRGRIDLDRVGSLVRHVAVDAGSDHARTDLGSHRMLAGLMTCEALGRERSQVSLRSMDVVARGAGHRRAGAKALAAPQQSDLIPVHVGGRGIPVRRGEQVVIQPFTRPVGERGPDLFPQARMAQGAVIQLPISGEACRIDNVFPAGLCRMGRLVLHMLVPVAVALCASNTQLIIARVLKRATLLFELEGGAVTFQTSGHNDACKVNLTIGIAWTVYPLIDSG